MHHFYNHICRYFGKRLLMDEEGVKRKPCFRRADTWRAEYWTASWIGCYPLDTLRERAHYSVRQHLPSTTGWIGYPSGEGRENSVSQEKHLDIICPVTGTSVETLFDYSKVGRWDELVIGWKILIISRGAVNGYSWTVQLWVMRFNTTIEWCNKQT